MTRCPVCGGTGSVDLVRPPRSSSVESLIGYTEGVFASLLAYSTIEDARLAVVKAQERLRSHYAPAARRGPCVLDGPCLLKEGG